MTWTCKTANTSHPLRLLWEGQTNHTNNTKSQINMNSPSCCQGTSINPHTLSYSNSTINTLPNLLPPTVRLTNFIWRSTSNPKCHVAFSKNNKNECQSTPTFSSKTSPQCHMPTGTRQDNLELLEDGAEIPKSQGRGWLSNSSSPLYLKKNTCQVVNYLLCFGAHLSTLRLRKSRGKKNEYRTCMAGST